MYCVYTLLSVVRHSKAVLALLLSKLASIVFIIFTVSADEFRYTCMGGKMYIDGVDDRADMIETQRTFSLLGKTLQCMCISDRNVGCNVNCVV